MLFLAAILALLIGVTLGLLGGGGSILTLPILVYVLHQDPKESIAASLFVVGTTALVSAITHARQGNVDYRRGLIFGAASMAGAFAGGQVAGRLPASVLLGAFAAMMLVTSIAMMRPRKESAEQHTLSVGRVLAAGAGVGLVAGLVGAGGGFLIVPALVLFGGLDMRKAIGTSLFVLTLQSFAGFAGHVTHTHVNWTLTAIVTTSAVIGSLGGVRLARRLSVQALRAGFAWFVLAMAVFMIGKQVSLAAAAIAAVVAVAVVLLVIRKGASHKDASGPVAGDKMAPGVHGAR